MWKIVRDDQDGQRVSHLRYENEEDPICDTRDEYDAAEEIRRELRNGKSNGKSNGNSKGK